MTDRIRVLVVDDHPLFRQGVVHSIESDPRLSVVGETASGEEALQLARELLPDVVLLDHHMPDVTGPEVLLRIRKIRAKEDLPVIMCTGNEDPDDIVRALEDGACDYIVKPVNIAVAIARIRTHLSLRDAYRVHAKQDRVDVVRALIVTLSHEINNPLAIASGHLEMIAAEGRLDPETQRQLSKVEHALDRIAQTILRARKLGRETEIEIATQGNDAPRVKF